MPRALRATSCDGLLGILGEYVELRSVEAHADGLAGLGLGTSIDPRDERLPRRRQVKLELIAQELDDIDLRVHRQVTVLLGQRAGLDVLRPDPDDDLLADRAAAAGRDRRL